MRERAKSLLRQLTGSKPLQRPQETGSAATTTYQGTATFDCTYDSRHFNRNRKKLSMIVRHASRAQTLLDIGCNRGYVSRALLEAGKTEQAVGVELDRQVVDPWLLDSDRFTLFEGRASDYPFHTQFDVTCYLAVHHHVFAKEGRIAALELWRKIVDSTRQSVFFETGEFGEIGDDWYWLRSFKEYYATNDDLFGDLIASIGPRLDRVSLIGRLPIHGIRRRILKIDLLPPEQAPVPPDESFYRNYSNADDWEVLQEWRRTVGSTKQRLVPNEAGGKNTYDCTTFHKIRHRTDGTILFGKRVLDNPYKQRREHCVLIQAKHPKIIALVGVHARFGLLFPFLDWTTLDRIDLDDIENASAFLCEVQQFYEDAAGITIDFGNLDRAFSSDRKPRSLIDVVDLHERNILVDVSGSRIRDWVVVDMEYVSTRNRARNLRHQANLMGRRPSSLSRNVLIARLRGQALWAAASVRGSRILRRGWPSSA